MFNLQVQKDSTEPFFSWERANTFTTGQNPTLIDLVITNKYANVIRFGQTSITFPLLDNHDNFCVFPVAI